MEFINVKIGGGRSVSLEKSVAIKVLARMEERKRQDKQTSMHMREAGMGPRNVAGSQFAPWIGKNTPKNKKEKKSDDGIVYRI